MCLGVLGNRQSSEELIFQLELLLSHLRGEEREQARFGRRKDFGMGNGGDTSNFGLGDTSFGMRKM